MSTDNWQKPAEVFIRTAPERCCFVLFAPIIASFCFVPKMCAERGGNSIRFQMIRSSKLKFSVSQFIGGAVSGGIALAAGYALFFGAAVLFPSVSEMSERALSFIFTDSFNFGVSLLCVWIYGIFWSAPAMLFTSFLRNKYLIICITFFFKYGFSPVITKLEAAATADFSDINADVLEITQTVSPNALLWLNNNPLAYRILFFYGALFAAFFTEFAVIRQNRRD